MQTSTCLVCGSTQRVAHYTGKIRTGRFGSASAAEHTVWRCAQCLAARLEGATVDYESDEYRRIVDGDGGADRFYAVHDGEQAEKLRIAGTSRLRGAVVADVGAGAGSFLDLASGMTAATLAIEPTVSFHDELKRKGHACYPYAEDALSEWGGRVDLAVCFSVIEHVEDPLRLLRSIRALLRPSGCALVSTPNLNDWLLDLLPAEYGSFFYRQVHRWYFDATSLERVGRLAGFSVAQPFHVHRFDAANFLVWLRDKRPSGLGKVPVPAAMGATFGPMLEAAGRSDYLYAWLQP